MALTHLFPRCPVLPVDGAISLARYLHSVEQTRAEAAACERAAPPADLERAALLHLRVVQLVCKTLPAHPDRVLPASASTLARLDAAAHDSLDAVERLARLLAAPPPAAADAAPSAPPPPPETRVPAPLLDVFANMVCDRSAEGARAVGVLAARIADSGDVRRVAALVVPAQADPAQPDADPVRHEQEIHALATHKALVPLGVVVHAPTARRARLLDGELRFAARIARGTAVAVVVAPEDEARVAVFEVADGEVVAAENVVFVEDELAFKLYDLRPLAKARDGQAASGVPAADE